MYYTLNEALSLASALNDTTYTANWTITANRLKTAANTLLWDPTTNLYRDNETTTLHPQDGNAWALKSNLTLSSQQSLSISTALRSRWGPYGAPAPEAGSPTISPFIGGFELEGHFLASQPQNSIDLLRRQWGFMLDDPRMTNSSFIEGYSVDGSLHYAPYTNDPRVSHAHGWATAPTALLSFYVAGIQLVGGAGKTWVIAPQMGDLTTVNAGFVTPLGEFANAVTGSGTNGSVLSMNFSTPAGTTGAVSLRGVSGSLVKGSVRVELVNGEAENLAGGNWTLVVDGGGLRGGNASTTASPVPFTGGARVGVVSKLLVAVPVVVMVVLWSP